MQCSSALRCLLTTGTIILGAVFLGAGKARATGFFVEQQSVEGVGRAQAGAAAAATDASTIFFNPAGMTRLSAAEASAGANVLFPHIRFRNNGSTAATPGTLGLLTRYAGGNGGNPGEVTAVPNGYVALPISPQNGRDLWIGVGLNFPFGLSAKYDKNWFGRYDSIKSQLKTINVSPVIAYRVNEYIALGGGIDFQHAGARLTSAIPNPFAPGGPSPGTDGLFDLKGKDNSFGYNVGLLFQPFAGTRIGLHYRSPMSYRLHGRVRTTGLTGPLAMQNGSRSASADLHLPDMISFGVAQQVGHKWTLLAGVIWSGWDRFHEIRVKTNNGQPDLVRLQNYRDSYALSIGAEYALTQRIVLRSGFQYDRTPTRDSTRNTSLPDGDRYWFAAGASYEVRNWLALDFAAAYVPFEKGHVNLDQTYFEGTPIQSVARVRGTATVRVTTASFNLRIHF